MSIDAQMDPSSATSKNSSVPNPEKAEATAAKTDVVSNNMTTTVQNAVHVKDEKMTSVSPTKDYEQPPTPG